MPHLNNGTGSNLAFASGPVQGVRANLGIEEHFVGALVFHGEGVVLFDEDLGEEGLVAESSVRVVAAAVDLCAVRQQIERVIQVFSGVAVLGMVRLQPLPDLMKFAREALLFTLELCERERIRVVGLQKLVLLGDDPIPVLRELIQLVCFTCHHEIQFVVQHPRERLTVRGRDLHSFVVVLDQPFYVFDEDRLPGAVRTLRVPARTHEVRVDVARAVLRDRHYETGSALPAVDRTLQVVAVGLRRFGGVPIRDEY